MPSPSISVVICTHNRAHHLAKAIESVLGQDLPVADYEVLVVDNRSTDGTRELVARYGERLRYLAEPQLGLSHARNTGWRNATAPLVALIDDDAIAERTWLRALRDAFSLDVRPSCVGGRVTPQWQSERPAWLSDTLALCLTIADWTETAHRITDLSIEWLVGANIAFRRDVLERLGGFSARLGRSGTRLLSGEEILLQRRLLDEGAVCWYAPEAGVRHVVTADRLTAAWFRRRYFAQGQSDAAIWRLENPSANGTAWRKAAREVMPLLRARLGFPDILREPTNQSDFTEHCGVMWRMGYVSGLLLGA